MGQQRTTGPTRRTYLGLVGATAGVAVAGGVPTPLGAQETTDARTVAVEQGGRCVTVEPFSGTEPVEDVYDFRYPTNRFDGPPGSPGSTFSSHGTTDLQRDDTSILFLYDGPGGLSLVVVHGHLDGGGSGGTIRFTVAGLPSGGEWVVRDDYYLLDGEEAPSNFDRWDVDGETHTIDWAYQGQRTDGGAFVGLGSEFEVTVEPAFNEAAPLAAEHDFGPVESWEVLSGDRDAPERFSLRLDQPITLRPGECEADADGIDDGDVDARIVDLSVDDGVFAAREDVSATVTVENTGDRDHTFYVGYSVFGPDDVGRHNDGTTDEPLALEMGETATKTVTWTVEDDAPSGSYDAKVIVWRNRVDQDLRTQLDDRRVESAFQVVGD